MGGRCHGDMRVLTTSTASMSNTTRTSGTGTPNMGPTDGGEKRRGKGWGREGHVDREVVEGKGLK